VQDEEHAIGNDRNVRNEHPGQNVEIPVWWQCDDGDVVFSIPNW